MRECGAERLLVGYIQLEMQLRRRLLEGTLVFRLHQIEHDILIDAVAMGYDYIVKHAEVHRTAHAFSQLSRSMWQRSLAIVALGHAFLFVLICL